MEKLLDLIADQRFPWFYPRHLVNSLKSQNLEHRLNQKKLPKVAVITFDIEEDYPDKTVITAGKFLKTITGLLRRNKVPVTFFVQASIIPEVAGDLQTLSRQGHEIGVHSLNHNNWGKNTWFLQDQPLTFLEKERDLRAISKIFEQFKLPEPRSFRCPNMNWRPDTFTLLIKYHYEFDSSLDTFRRFGCGIYRQGGLWEIPVSSLPSPKLTIRSGVPLSDFQVFNLANYLQMTKGRFDNYLVKVHWPLVFLAHPWEFFPNPKLSYCSPDNYQYLEKLIIELKNKKYQFSTLAQTAKMYGRS